MTNNNQRINISVQGQANLQGVDGGLQRTRRLASDLERQVKGIGDAFRALGTDGVRHLTTLTAGGLGAGAMYGRISGGLERHKHYLMQLDNEARTLKRLGDSYREYHRQVMETSRAYGFSSHETAALHTQLGRALGRREGAGGRVQDDMRLAQGFARGYGMSALESGAYFERAARRGITTGGGDLTPREFAMLVSDAVARGQMSGREGEVIGAIESLTDTINARRVDVVGTPQAAAWLTTLNATGIRGLQGERGADLLGRMNQAIMQPLAGDAGELFMYRTLSGGRPGVLSLAEYEYLKEEGLAGVGPTGETNLQRLLEEIHDLPLQGRYRTMAGARLTGLSMHEFEAIERTFMQDGQFQTARLGALREALGPEGLKRVDPSAWGLLAEAKAAQTPSEIARVAAEARQLGIETPSTDKDALFNQIRTRAEQGPILAEGQERERIDADLGKAAEAAGAKLYELEKAATQAATALINITGMAPGPLGGIAPIIAGGLAGTALGHGVPWLLGKGARLAGNPILDALAKRLPMGGPWGNLHSGGLLLTPGMTEDMRVMLGQDPEAARAYTQMGVLERAQHGVGNLFSGIRDLFGAEAARPDSYRRVTDAMAQAVNSQAQNIGQDFGVRFSRGLQNVTGVNGLAGLGGLGMGAPGGPSGTGSAYNGGIGGGGAATGALGIMFGGSNPGVMQEYGRTPFSMGAGRGMYGYGTQFGLTGDMHPGLDYAMAIGTPLYSPVDGVVTVAGGTGVFTDERYGNRPGTGQLTIKMANGHEVIMGHMESISVNVGQQVRAGAFVGRSGTYNAPHLHLEYRVPDSSTGSGMRIVDPRTYLARQQTQSSGSGGGGKTYKAARGGWWDVPADDVPTLLHKQEMVLPAYLAQRVRDAADRASSVRGETRGPREIRVRFDPVVLRYPDGSTQIVQARIEPFDGIIDHPIGGF